MPGPALRYVAHQLDADPDAVAAYAVRFQTRYEQLEALRKSFGFTALGRPQRRELLAWLLPVALAIASAPAIAATLMDELRRRQIIVPGPSVIERMVATAVLLAERQVAGRLTRGLSAGQAAALDALLRIKDGTPTSVLAWARQPPGAPGHRALSRLVEQLACLRAIGLDPALAAGVHPERLRRLTREGGRFTAQHLRALPPSRRRATLVATVLDATTRLTDDGVALFDRAVGRLSRRAEAREEDAILRNARAVNDKVRLLAELGDALLAARQGWVQDTCKKLSQGLRPRGAGALGDLADDASAGPAADLLLDLPDAEVGGRGERLDLADHARWRGGPAEMPAARLGGPHPGGHALADQRQLQLGHGADDGEHRPAHRAAGVDLILDADEAHPEVVELLERRQQVARAAGEAVELPDQHAVDLAVPGGRHQRVELGPALPAA